MPDEIPNAEIQLFTDASAMRHGGRPCTPAGDTFDTICRLRSVPRAVAALPPGVEISFCVFCQEEFNRRAGKPLTPPPAAVAPSAIVQSCDKAIAAAIFLLTEIQRDQDGTMRVLRYQTFMQAIRDGMKAASPPSRLPPPPAPPAPPAPTGNGGEGLH